ncbi:hypothetical protein GQ53DRAFT_363622 [Thozetella sp. PMI_491]|nr:hypothetical protein GQ53DRAFT_363622 [Thozetella sp. PMI_491]
MHGERRLPRPCEARSTGPEKRGPRRGSRPGFGVGGVCASGRVYCVELNGVLEGGKLGSKRERKKGTRGRGVDYNKDTGELMQTHGEGGDGGDLHWDSCGGGQRWGAPASRGEHGEEQEERTPGPWDGDAAGVAIFMDSRAAPGHSWLQQQLVSGRGRDAQRICSKQQRHGGYVCGLHLRTPLLGYLARRNGKGGSGGKREKKRAGTE